MTEMFKMSEMNDDQKIKPMAFLGALAAAPLSVALTFLALALILSPAEFAGAELGVILLIPFVGMFIGAPTYLTFGAFAFHGAIQTGRKSARGMALVGLRSHFVSSPLAAVILTLADPSTAFYLVAGYVLLGCIFAPLWSALFAVLYKRMS